MRRHSDKLRRAQGRPTGQGNPELIELEMGELKIWLTGQIEQRKVEPNSGLGEAITYMLKHWKTLTLFLREPGAPLDNNICEQALKKAILHRKNAYFYKTQHGARVADLFMSLIHTHSAMLRAGSVN